MYMSFLVELDSERLGVGAYHIGPLGVWFISLLLSKLLLSVGWCVVVNCSGGAMGDQLTGNTL